MLTNAVTASSLINLPQPEPSATAAQKVVIVNGSAGMLELLDTALDAGHYDIVFVESSDHAYSQIKRVQPHLVILCVRIDDIDGFRVLSMLKLDDETREIPVLTYTTEFDGEDAEEDVDDSADPPLFTSRPVAPRMN